MLYASNRSPGAFSHDSIATLGSFGALAAIAITQAQLLQDKEQALGYLHAANKDLRNQTRDTERAVEAHDRMMGIVLGGGGVNEVVSARQRARTAGWRPSTSTSHGSSASTTTATCPPTRSGRTGHDRSPDGVGATGVARPHRPRGQSARLAA